MLVKPSASLSSSSTAAWPLSTSELATEESEVVGDRERDLDRDFDFDFEPLSFDPVDLRRIPLILDLSLDFISGFPTEEALLESREAACDRVTGRDRDEPSISLIFTCEL